jgi:hypothetical protein
MIHAQQRESQTTGRNGMKSSSSALQRGRRRSHPLALLRSSRNISAELPAAGFDHPIVPPNWCGSIANAGTTSLPGRERASSAQSSSDHPPKASELSRAAEDGDMRVPSTSFASSRGSGLLAAISPAGPLSTSPRSTGIFLTSPARCRSLRTSTIRAGPVRAI